ncbi:potassium transporter 10-like [Argentina anserina]|uniref:potassium transporter 10-like n=1 Tax=Argentina anserina TaxID=57926 RepID=UPI002176703F|nr:potassium transporter 10-like [Potentilla anserina]
MATDEGTENNGPVWVLDQQFDQPMDEEARKLRNPYNGKKVSAFMVLQLAFQSLGVVYGDLGTSPLYVFYNTFPNGIGDPEDLVGALSVIIYSLTLIPLLKYVFIVCRANDNGQGGTFALYSLLCRYANIKATPNQDHTDETITTYSHSTFGGKSFAARTKRWLEGQPMMKNTLLILVLGGSSMVIGDGILTPAISVLSAVGGINVRRYEISNDVVVLVAVAMLVLLFTMQYHGTDKISWLFAPIVLLWFLFIGGIGLFNIWRYDRTVLKAFSPVYVYRFFKRGGKDGWTSLGGIMLSITGTEALFADLSHYPVLSIQIAFTSVVFPCLLLAYSGQAAYLMKHPDQVSNAFYHSIPDSIYWPVFVVATGAAVVASQSTITATFSLIKQALALGCFPRVKIVHTSKKYRHHIYIPEVNWLVMILCIGVTAGFKNQNQIGNASGTAVCMVMLVTTLLMILVMILVWRCHLILVLLFTGLSLVIEGTYFSAVLLKVNQGGWVPLVISAAFFVVMYTWHYGTVKLHEIEVHSKVSMAWILGLGASLGLVRIPGIGLVYTELTSGVPRIFSHFITNLPAIHDVVVFVCVKYLPVYTVQEEERFLVKQIGPKNFHMFRCVARYGYKDLHTRDDDFENKLFDSLFLFLRLESLAVASSASDVSSVLGDQAWPSRSGNSNSNIPYSTENPSLQSNDSIVPGGSPLHENNAMTCSDIQASSQVVQDEIDETVFLRNCRDAGVVHILGNTVVRASRDSNLWKRITIDYLYAFLRKIGRGNSVMLNVPHESLLNVGQVFHV